MPISIKLLGPIEVAAGEPPIRLGVRQQRLLAVLALHCGRTIAVDTLVDALWDCEPPLSARRQLSTAVWQLRRALADTGTLVRSEQTGYRLSVDPDLVDACRFESLVGKARLVGVQPRWAGELLREGLALWRGPALAGLTGIAFERETRRLDQLRLSPLEELAEVDLGFGRERMLVNELAGPAAEHPTRERLVAAYMLALYRSGRTAEAIAVYQRTATLLREEFGVDPGSALQRSYVDVLRADVPVKPPIRRHRAVSAIRLTDQSTSEPGPDDALGRRRTPCIFVRS